MSHVSRLPFANPDSAPRGAPAGCALLRLANRHAPITGPTVDPVAPSQRSRPGWRTLGFGRGPVAALLRRLRQWRGVSVIRSASGPASSAVDESEGHLASSPVASVPLRHQRHVGMGQVRAGVRVEFSSKDLVRAGVGSASRAVWSSAGNCHREHSVRSVTGRHWGDHPSGEPVDWHMLDR